MKCSACSKDKCRGNYENRHMCTGEKEGIECSCYCSKTKSEVFLSSALVIGTGVTVTAGKILSIICLNNPNVHNIINNLFSAGVGLAEATEGFAGNILGPAIASTGTSLITTSIQKLADKECVTITDSAIYEGLGASIGIANDSLVSKEVNAAVTKGENAAISLGARVIAGTTAGATIGAIYEGEKLIKGEKVSLESFGNSMAIGAIAGGVGSISTPIERSSFCTPIVDEIGESAMQAIVQASTSMATEKKWKKKFRNFIKIMN